MWMPLGSFRGNFRFHEKWTNGVFRGFSRQYKWCRAHAQSYKSWWHSYEFYERKYDQARKSPKISQKQPKLKVINTNIRTFPGPSSEHSEMFLRDMGDHWKGVMWLSTNMWIPFGSFRGNFGFYEYETNWVLRSFSRQCKWGRAAAQSYESCRYSYECFGRKFNQAQESSKMSRKQPKLKVIIHAFGLSRGPSSEHYEMPPRDMWGDWKRVTWLGTNIWMPFGSFRGNFEFHEEWTNGVFRGFLRQFKWCHAPVQCYKWCWHS